jgi:hypothetical protein
MSVPSLAIGQPLLKDRIPRGGLCGVKALAFLPLLALVFTVISSPAKDGKVQTPAVDMAFQARAPQFTQPVPSSKVWQAMKPAMARQFVQPVAAAASDKTDGMALVGKSSDSSLGRRAMLGSALAATAMVPIAQAGGSAVGRWSIDDKYKDDPEAAVEEIRRQQAEGEERRKQRLKKNQRTKAEVAADEEKQELPIKVALGLGALAVPFFAANLGRLGTKVASGGKNDGYSTTKGRQTAARGRGKQAAPPAKKGFFR